jgi:hypothetical protein
MQGTWRYAAGASGTVTLPVGATLKQIIVHSTAGGTVAIFGGTAIPVVAGTGFAIRFGHDVAVSSETPGGGTTIVFTGTDSYFVESIGPGFGAT